MVSQAGEMGGLFLEQKSRSQTAFQRNAWTCGSWYLLCLILFTPTAVWLLWTIRGAITQRTHRPTPNLPSGTLAPALPLEQPRPTAFNEPQPRASGFAPFSRGHPIPEPTPGTPFKFQAWSHSSSRAGNTQQDDTLKQLRRALYTASLQFTATFFCLGFAAGSWLWLAADAGRLIVSPTLHAVAILLTIWVYVIVGCLVNLFILIRTRREDDSSTSGGNVVPLSAMKASHVSSHRSELEREQDRKPMFIVAHTTTHVVVDDEPRHKSIGSETGIELGAGSAYSLSSSPGDGAGDTVEGGDEEKSTARYLPSAGGYHPHTPIPLMNNFLQTLLARAPPGESPYAYVVALMSRVLPEKSRWFFWMLAAGSLVNVVNLGLNLVCIYKIGARRKLGETSPYWIVRLRYDHASGIPYLVPNAIMAFLLFNGIFALLMQPYIWVNYVSYIDQTRLVGLRTGLFFWYGFIFVFDGSGMWISAFGTFYATLLPQLLISNKVNGSRFFVHPVFLNVLCYGLPAALFITQVITSALSQIAWRDMTLMQLKIVDQMQTLDHQWSANNKTVDSQLLSDTLALAFPFIQRIFQSRYAFTRNAITCGAWYLLCFLFFAPSAIWLLYVLRRTITHKLQFVTRMPMSGVDIQLPVPMERFSESNSHVDTQEGARESWKPPKPVALHLPPSCVSLAGGGTDGTNSNSGNTTPTSAGFLARTDAQQPAVVSPTRLEHARQDLEHGASHHPHDPGGGPAWELNTSAKATRKLQTAYYSAMLQFIATGFCLAVASGSWIWAASDPRVSTDLNLHATAVIMSVWLYPLVGIAVNVFICIRLKAIGSTSNAPKPKSKLMSYLQEVWASSSRSAQGTARS
ncbi:hypothetical protein FRC07_001530 [Ceratobasidium sp. 392]|nr:hypothetical protein FRC07_001530 [Ceratobasidium sp. 392]